MCAPEWLYGVALFCSVGWLIDSSVAAFIAQLNAAIDKKADEMLLKCQERDRAG